MHYRNSFLSKNCRRERKGRSVKNRGQKEKVKTEMTTLSLPPTPAGFVIAKNSAGFNLVSTTDAEKWNFPGKIQIAMAYDIVTGHPLKNINKFDFESITVNCESGKYFAIESNEIIFEVFNHNFNLSAKLPDLTRDLFVQAEIAE